MYKKAIMINLRVPTNKGLLTLEQLKDLKKEELDTIAISLEEKWKNSGKKSFLSKKTKKDKELKLAFDIVIDILNDKVEAEEQNSKDAEKKAHNEKILARIAKKKDDELDELSVKDLEKLLK